MPSATPAYPTPSPEELPRRVGVIGLGRMGMPIAARLVASGFEVLGTDREPGRREEAESVGLAWRTDSAVLAADVAVAITVLPGPAEVSAVTDAVIGALPAGCVWLDLSTASPGVAKRIALTARRRSIAVVDAPLGGGPANAENGTLLSFAGGSDADLTRVSDVLSAVASRVVHVGSHGSGYTLKLIANALWFEQAVATAEALAIAARAGLDLGTAQAALALSAAGRGFVAADGPALLAGDTMPAFSLARCAAQLSALHDYAAELAVPVDVLATVAQVHTDAVAAYGDVDGELLGARFAAERAGVRFGS